MTMIILFITCSKAESLPFEAHPRPARSPDGPAIRNARPAGAVPSVRLSKEEPMSNPLRFPLLGLAIVAALSLAGCSEDKANPLAPVAPARVMAVHASPDAPAV